MTKTTNSYRHKLVHDDSADLCRLSMQLGRLRLADGLSLDDPTTGFFGNKRQGAVPEEKPIAQLLDIFIATGVKHVSAGGYSELIDHVFVETENFDIVVAHVQEIMLGNASVVSGECWSGLTRNVAPAKLPSITPHDPASETRLVPSAHDLCEALGPDRSPGAVFRERQHNSLRG